jgi:hypothetical protein
VPTFGEFPFVFSIRPMSQPRLINEKLRMFKDPVRTCGEHFVWVIKTDHQLMLYTDIVTVCSENHAKHTNALCGQNGELMNVKPDVI